MLKKIFNSVVKHKIISLVALLAIIGGGYYGYNKFYGGNVRVSYITSAVEKGTLTTSISSSGQVSASNQVDIKSKVSGDIIKIMVQDGQTVKAGDIIAQLDAQDAYKSVRDASTNLQSAQLALDKLKQPADSYSIMQAENALTNAQASLEKLKLSQPNDYQTALETKQKAQDALDKSYEDAFNAISNAFVDFPNIMTGLDDMLYGYGISLSETSVGAGQYNLLALLNSSDVTDLVSDRSKINSMQVGVEADYKTADTKYTDCLTDYKNTNRYSDQSVIENLLIKTTETAKVISQALKSTSSYLSAWSDFRTKRGRSVFTKVTEYQTNLTTYSSQANTYLASLLTLEATLNSDKNAVDAAVNNIQALDQNNPLDMAAAVASVKEKQASLAKLKAGTDPLDLRSQELSVQQKRNALLDAQTTLANYTIRAPFDGVIATVSLKVGDSAGSTGLATIITRQQIAEISLNEVDAAKIKLGQKAIMTFDAIDGLAITGKVADIDIIGTVSQGVVTYNVKIVFDTQDSRVKPGMSANVTIITDFKTDVLTVPNTAIKTDANGGSYIQTLDSAGQPQNITVQIGLANDTNAEITSGLNEGDKVITQTITSAASKTATTQPGGNGLIIPGLGGGGR